MPKAQSIEHRLRSLTDVVSDVRYGLRTARGDPLFAAVAVLTLALGIGANTAIFSLADAVLLRALPVKSPQELILLHQRGPAGDIFPFSSAAAVNLAETRDVLFGLAAFRPVPNTHITVNGETNLALAQWVSGNYYAVLGVDAALGRTLSESDDEPVAVISYRYWQQRFAGARDVVGRLLTIQERSFTIVGVTPREFYGTQPGRYVDVTVPLTTSRLQLPPNARWLYLVGRLAPDVSRDQARAALRVRWAQIAASLPSRPPVTLDLESGAQGLNELRRQFSRPLRILMASVNVVLLLACANVAGLLLARAIVRQHEIAVRLALGATRGRIVRQLVTESVLLAAAGGAAGIWLAYAVTNLILAMMSRGQAPIALDAAPNARTLVFTLLVTMVTVLVFGLLPAVAVSRPAVQPRLQPNRATTNRTRTAWGRTMVAAQVALLVLLLTSAGLFVGTLQNLRSVDPGFRQESVLVVSIATGPAYRGASGRALYADLYHRFSALPSVQSVSLTMDTPLGGDPSMSSSGINVLGRPPVPDEPRVFHNFVGPRFFETMGIGVLAGRDFTAEDNERAPKRVVVSESVARRYFPGENPLGRQILFGGAAATIVGIANDVRFTSLRAAAPLVTYRASLQDPTAPANTFLIRAATSVDLLTPYLRAEIHAAAPALPPPAIVKMEDQVAASLLEERMLAALSSAFGVLAAILAAIGIHSMSASLVARRRREIGIRIALGAVPGQVVRMMVRNICTVLAWGLAIGTLVTLAAGLAARSLLAHALFEVSLFDPFILGASVLSILLIASLAAYAPARQATRVDPVIALKDA
jgi:putative ABC transport system permease protein